jgi:hypothetical protein
MSVCGLFGNHRTVRSIVTLREEKLIPTSLCMSSPFRPSTFRLDDDRQSLLELAPIG